MLRAFELENFKAFGQPTTIELAPITLFFGENSAGKSSILQGLNLLKQTHESREAGAALLPPPQRLPRLFAVPEWDPAAGRSDLAPLRTAAAGDVRILPAGGH